MRFSVNEQSFVSTERIGVLEKFVAQEKIGLQILQDVYLRSVYLDIRPVKLPLESLNTTKRLSSTPIHELQQLAVFGVGVDTISPLPGISRGHQADVRAGVRQREY